MGASDTLQYDDFGKRQKEMRIKKEDGVKILKRKRRMREMKTKQRNTFRGLI